MMGKTRRRKGAHSAQFTRLFTQRYFRLSIHCSQYIKYHQKVFLSLISSSYKNGLKSSKYSITVITSFYKIILDFIIFSRSFLLEKYPEKAKHSFSENSRPAPKYQHPLLRYLLQIFLLLGSVCLIIPVKPKIRYTQKK